MTPIFTRSRRSGAMMRPDQMVAPGDAALVARSMRSMRTVSQRSTYVDCATIGVVDQRSSNPTLSNTATSHSGFDGAVCRILALVVGGPEQGTLQQTGVRGRVGQTGDVYAAALAVLVDRELHLTTVGAQQRHVLVDRERVRDRLAEVDAAKLA